MNLRLEYGAHFGSCSFAVAIPTIFAVFLIFAVCITPYLSCAVLVPHRSLFISDLAGFKKAARGLLGRLE